MDSSSPSGRYRSDDFAEAGKATDWQFTLTLVAERQCPATTPRDGEDTGAG